LDRVARQANRRFFVSTAQSLDEMVNKNWNILSAIAKRRDFNLHNAQPIKKVLAEITPLNLVLNPSARGRDEPDASPHRLGTTQTFELAILYYTQQFCLEYRRHFGDFVEEYGSPTRRLKFARVHTPGPILCHPFLSEELAFNQSTRDRRKIDFCEGFFATVTQSMDLACNYLLANSTFSVDKDDGSGLSNQLELFSDVLNHLRITHQ
jgi:hypothetical protein